jgi:DNA primase
LSTTDRIKILNKILGTSYQTGDEYLFYCPKCEHRKRKLSINLTKNKFKCWICDYSGKEIYRLVRRFGTRDQRHQWAQVSNIEINDFENLFQEEVVEEREVATLPEEFVSLTNKSLPLNSIQARRYLKKRNICKKDILKWKIGYCPSGDYQKRIIIPSFSENGKLNYFIARAYDNSWKKYLNPSVSKDIIFNELYIDWEKDITLVEGAFDAIVAGDNSIPLLGSTLRENSVLFQKLVENEPEIYIALDPDAEKKSLNLISDLLLYGIKIFKINISPYLDVGEMTQEEFKKRKKEAVLINSNNYLLARSRLL